MWRFVHTGASQFYLRLVHGRGHHVIRNLRLALACSGLSIEHTSRLLASHNAASAMNGGIERKLSVWIFDTFENYRGFGHSSSDEAFLAGESWRCAFTHD